MLKRGVILFAYLFCMTMSAYAEQPVTIVFMDKAAPPRIMGDGGAVDEVKPGITIELFRMVSEKIDVPFVFKRMPWKRCLFAIEHGQADATFHASYKLDRAKYGVFPMKDGILDPERRIYENAYMLYVRKGSKVVWDGEKIMGLDRPIGTQLSYAVADDLKKMGYKVEEEGGVGDNLKKLLAGRISAYVELQNIADTEIFTHLGDYGQVERLSPPIRQKDYYLLISKKFSTDHPKLTQQIFDAIRDVQKTPEYFEMVERY